MFVPQHPVAVQLLPWANGIVESFHGRVSSEVLGITIYSHRDLEQLLRGFNAAYNARRQRVLDGKTPDQIVAERLKARCQLASAKSCGRAGPNDISKARLIVEAAKEVSQPDTQRSSESGLQGQTQGYYVFALPAVNGESQTDHR